MAISSDNPSTKEAKDTSIPSLEPTPTSIPEPTPTSTLESAPTSTLEPTPTSTLEPPQPSKLEPNPPSPSTSTASTLPVEVQPTTAVSDPSKPPITKIVTSNSKPSSTHSQEHDKNHIHLHQEVDNTAEFVGEVNTNNELPTAEIIKKIGDYTVLDKEGKSVPFRNVYSGPHVVRRVLVIFIRHFFCGNCQEYIRTLSSNPSFSPQNLLSQSPPTFICIIGCGSPALIPMYTNQTSCPYPIYTDPTKQLYTALKMIRTFSFGEKRPAYMKHNMFGLAVQSVVQGVKELGKGRAFKNGEWGGGDMGQVGGEFLFESKNGDYSPGGISPGETPDSEATPNAAFKEGGGKAGDYLEAGNVHGKEDEKVVTWCHRMRHTRDHAELGTLMEVLGVDVETERLRREFGEKKLTGMSARSKASSLAGGSEKDFEAGTTEVTVQ